MEDEGWSWDFLEFRKYGIMIRVPLLRNVGLIFWFYSVEEKTESEGTEHEEALLLRARM